MSKHPIRLGSRVRDLRTGQIGVVRGWRAGFGVTLWIAGRVAQRQRSEIVRAHKRQRETKEVDCDDSDG